MKSRPNFSSIKALFINCTLKNSSKKSHTEGAIDLIGHILPNWKRQVGCMEQKHARPAQTERYEQSLITNQVK